VVDYAKSYIFTSASDTDACQTRMRSRSTQTSAAQYLVQYRPATVIHCRFDKSLSERLFCLGT
jgi:hypothetical protein